MFCKRDRQTIQAASSSTVDGLSLALQSGEIALRHGPSRDPNLKIHGAGGRRFFAFHPSVPIANGGEILKGFFQSLRPTVSGLVLNLDVAYSCFLGGGPFLEVAAKILGQGGASGGGRAGYGGGSDRGGRGRGGFQRGGRGGYGGGGGGRAIITRLSIHEQQTLRKALNGVRIKPNHRQGAREQRLTGLTPKSAYETTFLVSKDRNSRNEDDRRTNIVDYYRTKYNRSLQYPDLPCAILSGQAIIPLEFCDILSGTPIPPQKMKPAQVQEMIRESAFKPSARRERNMEIRRNNAYEKNALLKNFDMNISSNPIRLEARVLSPPQVLYGNDKRLNASNGAWNLINVKFCNPGDLLQTVVLLNFARRSEQECRHFAETQLAACQRLGMNIRVRNMHYAQCQADPSRVFDAMKEAGRAAYHLGGKQKTPQLYFLFFDEMNAPLYETIKRVAALELASPVATQCVNVQKGFARDERKQGQYCANVSMKVSSAFWKNCQYRNSFVYSYYPASKSHRLTSSLEEPIR